MENLVEVTYTQNLIAFHRNVLSTGIRRYLAQPSDLRWSVLSRPTFFLSWATNDIGVTYVTVRGREENTGKQLISRRLELHKYKTYSTVPDTKLRFVSGQYMIPYRLLITLFLSSCVLLLKVHRDTDSPRLQSSVILS